VMMLTLRQSPFEPWNTYPCIVRDFYALALRMFGVGDTTLMQMYASVEAPEKLPKSMKGPRVATGKKCRTTTSLAVIRRRAEAKAIATAKAVDAPLRATINQDGALPTASTLQQQQQQPQRQSSHKDVVVQYI